LQHKVQQWQDWVGRSTTLNETLYAAPINGLIATLDRDLPAAQNGDEIPPGGHWLYFLEHTRQRDLDVDGHAIRGGFLPPVDLPRRMWAGGKLTFLKPLHIGERVTKQSAIQSVTFKDGHSGSLVFVTVEHQLTGVDGLALIEQHDIVYRSNQSTLPVAASKPLIKAPWMRSLAADEVMLMRYSALTFNGHRIHYDKDFAMSHDGYPGLVVHGPLMATLLMDLCTRHHPENPLSRFDFRARSALFASEPFHVLGTLSSDRKSADLTIQKQDGTLVMTAQAEFNES